MNNEKWTIFLDSAFNPICRSSAVPERIEETKRAIDRVFCGVPKGNRILDLGCGDGLELDYLKELGFTNVVGVNRHPRELRPDMTNADIHELPFPDQSFDFVYSKETLEHALCPFVAAYESGRVLKIGGRFAHYITEGMEKQREPYHFSCLPSWAWVDIFLKAGLSLDELWSKHDQSLYIGKKIYTRKLEKEFSLYQLSDVIRAIYRGELVI